MLKVEMNSKTIFVVLCLIICFSIQETSGMRRYNGLASKGSSSGDRSFVGSAEVSLTEAGSRIYSIEDSVRRRKFFEVIDQFETMEINFTKISETDKESLLEMLDKGLPMTDIESYTAKTLSLECAYDFASLYMLYHIKRMYCYDKNIRPKDIQHTLSQYSQYMHRIILIKHMLNVPILLATWSVAIYIDALHNGFDTFDDRTFDGIVDLIKGPLKNCHELGKIDRNFIEPKDIPTCDLDAQNSKLLSRLRLSEGVLSDLFGGEHRYDVYRFFLSKKHNINEKFAPPRVWFKTYVNSILEGLHCDVKATWKTRPVALCKYTSTIKDLVLMTAYYALLRHCRFLLATWYILVDRVNLGESGSQMREERKKLMQTPLPVLEMIFLNLDSALDIRFLSDIEANLNNDESACKSKFIEFVKQVVATYNLYAINVRARQLTYDTWLDWPNTDGFTVQTRFLYENPNIPSFQTAIMENIKILQSYYDEVVETLSPTDFAAIEYFSSVQNAGKN